MTSVAHHALLRLTAHAHSRRIWHPATFFIAAWLLTIDERTNGSIMRSPSRLLVLTTDVDSVLRDLREWIDNACTAARVRDAIVTDGTRWATHRKGDRQLRRPGYLPAAGGVSCEFRQ